MGYEAALFAGDLYRMYVRYCEGRGWTTEVTSVSEGTAGGYKEIVFTVSLGDGVYGVLKCESGVHRVQRVPETETQGRVHTSAASVAALPEAEEVDVVLNRRYRDADRTLWRGWWTECKQGRNKGPAHPQAYRHRSRLPTGSYPAGKP